MTDQTLAGGGRQREEAAAAEAKEGKGTGDSSNSNNPGGGLASRGWFIHSKPNRVCVFKADYLHGVVPGG